LSPPSPAKPILQAETPWSATPDPLRASVEALARVHDDMSRLLRGNDPQGLMARLSEAMRALTLLIDAPHAGALPTVWNPGNGALPIALITDSDCGWRDAIITALAGHGQPARGFATGEELLSAHQWRREACAVIGPNVAHEESCAVLCRVLPAVAVVGPGNVTGAVAAIKAGASEAIEMPAEAPDLTRAIARALNNARDSRARLQWREQATRRIAGLTPRQRQVLHLVVAGFANKNIACELGISQRSVENHRAQIMRRTGSKSLAALARLVLAASSREEADRAA
jgi:two-component system CheB/CheR fusion protein